MNRRLVAFLLVGFLGLMAWEGSAQAWVVSSPSHGQTFAYGSERHRQWIARGPNRHLALSVAFTNDPYVDRTEPRQEDDFVFDFPNITLGSDGRTFYYRAPGGHLIPVATHGAGFLGIGETTLLPGSVVVIRKPHGYVTVELFVAGGRLSPENESPAD